MIYVDDLLYIVTCPMNGRVSGWTLVRYCGGAGCFVHRTVENWCMCVVILFVRSPAAPFPPSRRLAYLSVCLCAALRLVGRPCVLWCWFLWRYTDKGDRNDLSMAMVF